MARRVPAGVPAGGQFAPQTHPEAPVALIESASPGQIPEQVSPHQCFAPGGAHRPGCNCPDRAVTAASTIREIDAILTDLDSRGPDLDPPAEAARQRLSAHAAALVINQTDPDAVTADLDWDEDGLQVIATHNAFMEEGDSTIPEASRYTTNLSAGRDNYLDCLTVMPEGTQRLDLYHAIHGHTII